MKKILTLLLLLAAFVFPSCISAQSWDWGAINQGGGIDAWNVASDNAGNVFVAGWAYDGTATKFGSHTVAAGSSSGGGYGYQVVVAKYDSSGTCLWALGNSSGQAYPFSIACDPFGNCYVFGGFESSSLKFGTKTCSSSYGTSDWKYFILKLDAAGHVVWLKSDGNCPSTYEYVSLGSTTSYVLSTGGIATDTGGNIYVTTSFSRSSTKVGSYTLTNSGSSGTYDILLAKYDSSGTNLWAVKAGGTKDDNSYSVAVAPSGAIYICGDFFSRTLKFDSTTLTNSAFSSSESNIFLARYADSTPVWAIRAGSGEEDAVGLTTDVASNVYMTGGFAETNMAMDDSTIHNPNPSTASLYLVKIDPYNVLEWAKVLYGTSSSTYCYGYSISTDACGDVWVSGNLSGNIKVAPGHTLTPASGASDPVFMAGYSISGSLIGSASLASGGDDQNQIACDIYGNVFLESDFQGSTFKVGSHTYTESSGGGGEYLYVAKYANAISVTHDSTANDTSMCITDSVTLSAPAGKLGYVWNDGDTARVRNIFTTGTYWVVGIGNCLISTSVDTFHIHTPTGDTIFYSSDTVLCPPYHLTLAAPPGYYTYAWNFSSVADSDTVTVTAPGTYYVFAVGKCNSLYDTFHVRAATLDTSRIVWDTTICSIYGAITLKATVLDSGFTHLWSTGSAGDSISVSTPNSYYVYNDSGCTVVIDTFNVHVHYLDSTFKGSDTVLCAGIDSITNAAPGGYASYKWNNGDTGLVHTSATMTTWLYATPANCMLPTLVDTFGVTLHYPDTVFARQDTTICPGIDSITDVAPAGYAGYNWSNGATGQITTQGTGTVVVYCVPFSCLSHTYADSFVTTIHYPDTTYMHQDTSVCANVTAITETAPAGYISYVWNTGATTATYTGTDSVDWVYGTAATCFVPNIIDTFHRFAIPLPLVNLGNDTSLCTPFSLVLQSSDAYTAPTYLWSTGSTSATITATANGTYWLAVTDNSCTSIGTITINTGVPPLVSLIPDTMICRGSSIKLQSLIVEPANATYSWNTGDSARSIVVSDSGTYTLSVTVKNCVGTASTTIDVVNDSLIILTHDTAICKGASVQINATALPTPADFTYQWTPTTGISMPTVLNSIVTPDTSAMYYVTAVGLGCPPLKDSVYIDVQPNPTLYMGGNRFTCEFDSLHLQPVVAPAGYAHYSYSWSPAGAVDNTGSLPVVFLSDSSLEVYLTVTTPAGCTTTDSALIVVWPGNFSNVNPKYVVLCPGDSVQLADTGGVTYQWKPANYIGNTSAGTTWAYPITSQAYSVIATSAHGCTDTQQVSITVNPNASYTMADSVTLYPGDTYHITPTTNCLNFAWYPSLGLSNTTISDPIANPPVSTKYYVRATTENGCMIVDSIYVYVDPETLLAIPNAFAPGNGPNSEFKVIKKGLATLNYLRIYNRWGNLVFETTDIMQGWDGTYKGKAQPEDVYVYVVEAVTVSGNIFKKQGNLTLIR
jgi:gliding motility-associated-like protein